MDGVDDTLQWDLIDPARGVVEALRHRVDHGVEVFREVRDRTGDLALSGDGRRRQTLHRAFMQSRHHDSTGGGEDCERSGDRGPDACGVRLAGTWACVISHFPLCAL